MPTKIIIPNPEYSADMRILAERSESEARSVADSTHAVLANTSYENSDLVLNSGIVAGTDFRVFESDFEKAAPDRDPRTPRVLEAINAILLDDISKSDEKILQERAVILDNFDIDLVSPVTIAASNNPDFWHLSKVGAPHQSYSGKNVRIGILDTGIDAKHPEFKGKDIAFMEFDSSGFPISTSPRDASDHGTHVSAIASGNSCGVAPKADLAVAAVLTKKTKTGMSGSLAQILAGYNWLVHTNHSKVGASISQCAVVNASLGASGYNSFLYNSIDTLLILKRCLMIAAIGNSGMGGADLHGSPGNYDIVVGVGATDINDIVAPFSDWGLEHTHGAFKPDMSAPGYSVRSAIPGGGYAFMPGTSMAAPMVAGAAALLLEKQPSYARNPVALSKALSRSVSTLTNTNPANLDSANPSYSRIGSGRLDVSLI